MSTPLQAAAQQRLRSLVEKIERLEEDKAALGSDISDEFLSAKAEGYDVKALRRILKMRKKSASEREEEDAIVDVYARALGMRGTPMDDYFSGAALAAKVEEIGTAHGISREVIDATKAGYADKAVTCTVSVDGGPEVPLDMAIAALDVVKSRGKGKSAKYSGHNRSR
jgi:uncharacterized protein (UPF0335 family)